MRSEEMEPKFLIFYTLILLKQKIYSAIKIEECPAGIRNVTEDSEISLTCVEYDEEINWYISTNNSLGDKIGHCYQDSCDPTERNHFLLDAEFSRTSRWYRSTLDITRVTRDEARVFHCKDYYTGDRASCRLRVTAPAEVVHSNCRVWTSDLQVQGGCLVQKMYPSYNFYKCTWSVGNVQITGVFQSSLSSYQSGGRNYMRGSCYFRQQIPLNGYSFTNSINYTYTISIDPGPQNIRVTTISIVPPSNPEINCLEIVLEGSTVICMCTSQIKGNPPAKFVWDGIDNDTLVLRNVSRQQSFTNYTCRQTWGPYGVINTTVNYTFTVASNNTAFPTSFGTQIFVGDYPSTQTDIYSSVTGTEQSITQADQQNIHSQDSSSSDSNNGGLIGGVVAAVMVAIIVGAVIVVIIVKRRKDPEYEKAKRIANNEHNYEDLTHNRCEVRHPTGASYEEVIKQNTDEHVYGDVILKVQNAP